MDKAFVGDIIAIVSPIIFAVMWLISAVTDGNWVFGVDALSDLGISPNKTSAAFFNWGCIIMGAFTMLGSALRYDSKSKLYNVSCIMTCVGGFLLAGIGIFTLDTGDPHNFSSLGFAAMMIGAMIISLYMDWKDAKLYFAITAGMMLLCAILLIGMFITNSPFGLPQAMMIITTIIWSITLGIKELRMRPKESQ